jgi:signal transduction histidine kinase
LTGETVDRLSELFHDLRTPLGVVIGYAELLRARDDERIRREAVPRIIEAAERLSALLDELENELRRAD